MAKTNNNEQKEKVEQDFFYEKEIVKQDFPGVLGQEEVKHQLKSVILMRRHVLIVGQPGIGKTTLVKSIASMLPKKKVVDKKTGKEELVSPVFVRVQGSPDLTAEDLIGDIDPIKAIKFGPLSIEAFTPGKIFKADGGILFFDEVNRCSEKLQNALLQALEERKVTIGSYDVDMNADFIFVGTMNPEEASTEPLSDVFLDRFDVIFMEPPNKQAVEEQIVLLKGRKLVEFPKELLSGTIAFIRAMRENPDLEKKPSVRASLGIYERAQANAYLDGRSFVDLEDVNDALTSVLSHRIRLKPSLKYLKSTTDYLREQFSEFCEQNNLGKGGSR
ncbi:MAG: AAA family ATPase [Candidatus Nanoarchaeia archaeon]